MTVAPKPDMRDTLQAIAAYIASELERLTDLFMYETDLHKKQNLGIEIRQFLWDNKMGILRVMQDRARLREATRRLLGAAKAFEENPVSEDGGHDLFLAISGAETVLGTDDEQTRG